MIALGVGSFEEGELEYLHNFLTLLTWIVREVARGVWYKVFSFIGIDSKTNSLIPTIYIDADIRIPGTAIIKEWRCTPSVPPSLLPSFPSCFLFNGIQSRPPNIMMRGDKCPVQMVRRAPPPPCQINVLGKTHTSTQ